MATKTSDNNRSKPRKPLSAYNLFYRYKRAKMVEANGNGTTKEDVCNLVGTSAGLENYPPSMNSMLPPDRLDEFRRANIRLALGQDLFSKDTRNRKHRKSTNGFKMSFVEMNRMMVDNWKGADKFTKAAFQELADEARKAYQQQLIECSLAHHIIARNSTVVNNSSPQDLPKTETSKLGFTQLQEASLVTLKAKDPVAAQAKSVLDFGWEPLPFTNEEISTETKPSLPTDVFHTLPKAAVPSSSRPASISIQGAHYPSPDHAKLCFPPIVTPTPDWTKEHANNHHITGTFDASSFCNGSEHISHVDYPPLPSLIMKPERSTISDTNGSYSFGSQTSAGSIKPALPSTMFRSLTNRVETFISSFPPPPFTGESDSSNINESSSSGFSEYKLGAAKNDVSVNDFMELIKMLGEDC